MAENIGAEEKIEEQEVKKVIPKEKVILTGDRPTGKLHIGQDRKSVV